MQSLRSDRNQFQSLQIHAELDPGMGRVVREKMTDPLLLPIRRMSWQPGRKKIKATPAAY